MQKKDRDCGDNAQRDEDEERDPHANRNAVGKRVTTGWHSHESREPFVEFHGFRSPGEKPERGQPFTYELFDALRPSEFERRGSWFAESSEPPNCCWAYGITPQFRRDSIRRDPSTA